LKGEGVAKTAGAALAIFLAKDTENTYNKFRGRNGFDVIREL
jgi:hypothetical protein